MNKAKRVGTISQLMEELRNGGLASVDRPHLNLWFRGQAKAEWKLLPKVF